MKSALLFCFFAGYGLFAFAQDSAVPSTLKQSEDVKVEVGMHYWRGLNNTKYNYYSTSATRGNPAATLTWKDAPSDNIELFAISSVGSDYFIKGNVGFGVSSQKSGSLTNVDYNAGQITFSDTTSSATNSRNGSAGIEFGRIMRLNEMVLKPSVGYYYSRSLLDSYGLYLNPVGDGSFYAANGVAAGQTVRNSDFLGISYETIVKSPKLGLGATFKVGGSTSITLEGAYYPFADITLFDYHRSSDKVQNGEPNGVSNGRGSGYGFDLFVNHMASQRLTLLTGIKFSSFTLSDRDMAFNNVAGGWSINRNGLKSLDIQQLGFTFGAKYSF